MKQKTALFIKEFKVMSRLYAIPLIIMIGLLIFDSFYTFSRMDGQILHFTRSQTIFLNFFFVISRILAGGLLIYALSVERKTGTLYQNMSMPCRRYETVSYKYLVAVLYCLVFSFGQTIMYYLQVREGELARGRDISQIGLEFLIFLDHFSFMFMVTGMACLIWGIISAIRKLPVFIGTSSVFIIATFMVWFKENLLPLLNLANHVRFRMIGSGYNSYKIQMRHFNASYYLAIGLVFAAAGLYIYNRFSEV